MKQLLFAAVSAVMLTSAVAAFAQGLPASHQYTSTDHAWSVNSR